MLGANAVDCPLCFGNLLGCSYGTDGKCPTTTKVAANAAALAATTATGVLCLANLVKPRFLRVFDRSSLSAIFSLARRPAPGTPFTLDAATSLSKVLQAISSGQFTVELALMRYAELIDVETDDKVLKKLLANVKLLTATKDVKGFASSASSAEFGVWSWLWAKITTFVFNSGKGGKIALNIDGESSLGSSGASVHAATIKRLTVMSDFFEALNLLVMLSVSLGLTATVTITDFLQFVVFDTIRRERTWQFAHELLVLMFRRVEDSAGDLNLGTVYNESYLNTLMEEAGRNVAAYFPKLDFFRTHGGIPESEQPNGKNTVVWNNKFTSSSQRPCAAFNNKRKHKADDLSADGTCKFNHVCNKWVSDKGSGGRCMDPGHAHADCNNPSKCDARVQ